MANKKYHSNPVQQKGKISSVVLVTNRKCSNKMRPIEFVHCPVVLLTLLHTTYEIYVPNHKKDEVTILSATVELEVGHSSHKGPCFGHLKY
mmetsp:Transcript_21156/g.46893  ORF Transcript_21156/g.46893 Transcript_21156/m.46893 type:complete len:91 (-) Transcript_21156:502-774(-)